MSSENRSRNVEFKDWLTEFVLTNSESHSDFDDLMQIALRALNADAGYVFIEESGVQLALAKLGFENLPQLPSLAEFGFSQGASLEAAWHTENSSRISFGRYESFSQSEYRSFAAFAITDSDGRVFGAFILATEARREFDPSDFKVLNHLCRQVCRLLELRRDESEANKIRQSLTIRNLAAEVVSDGIIIRDHDGRLLDFNSSALEILGYSREQFISKMTDRPRWNAVLEDGTALPDTDHPAFQALKTGRRYRQDKLIIIRPDGLRVNLMVNAEPIRDVETGAINGVVISFSDITSLFESETRFERSEKELRFLLDSIPHMVGLWSSDFKNLHANSAYYDYFSKTPDELRGMHMRDLLGEPMFTNSRTMLNRVVSGETVSFEREFIHRDGRKRQFLVSYIPNRFEDHIATFLAIALDMTEMKELERSRQDVEIKMTEAARLFALGEMANGVAHELNNPLAIINGKAATIRRKAAAPDFVPEVLNGHLETIDKTIDRMATIISGLRSFSHNAENDPFEIIPLTNVIEKTAQLCTERLKASGIRLHVQADQKFELQCRSTQISQILMNLLNNSLDAISDQPDAWIRIQVNSDHERIYLSVTDSGPGIPLQIAKKLMQPFFTTKEVGKGTGLSLSVSKKVIESHGGSLRYAPEFPNTTFIVELPIRQLQARFQSKSA